MDRYFFKLATTNYRKEKGKEKQKGLHVAWAKPSSADLASPPGARGFSSPPRTPKLLGGKVPEKPSTSTRLQPPPAPHGSSTRATETSEDPCFHSPSSQRVSTSIQLAREELQEHRRPWRWRHAARA